LETFEHSYADEWQAMESSFYFYSKDLGNAYGLIYSLNEVDLNCEAIGTESLPF